MDDAGRRDVLARILEVPLLRLVPGWMTAWRVLRPMRWATAGTMLTCRLARERGLEKELQQGWSQTRVAAVGPVVADTLRAHGAPVHICPEQGFVMKNLVQLIKRELPPGSHLELFVKVDKDWQRRPDRIDRLGY